MGRHGGSVRIFDYVDHGAVGKLQPIKMVAVYHIGYLFDSQNNLVPPKSFVLTFDVVGDVVDTL